MPEFGGEVARGQESGRRSADQAATAFSAEAWARPDAPAPVEPKPAADEPRLSDSQNSAVVEAALKAIRTATKRDQFIDTGTDEDAIYRALGSLTEDQRKALADAYDKKYNITLANELKREMSGAEEDKALNLLNRKDGSADDAGFCHELFVEMHQLITGRSRGVVGAVFERKLSSMSVEELATLDNEYKSRYGIGLRDTIKNDSKLNDSIKGSLDKLFVSNDRSSAQKVDHTLPELIKANTSWLGDNERGIEEAVESVSDAERQSYLRGRELSQSHADQKSMSEADRAALKFYTDTHKALDKAGNATEVAEWEGLLVHKGSPLMKELAGHRGIFKDDSTSKVLASIENMDSQDWERLKQDPSFRRDVDTLLGSFLSNAEMARAKTILDGKQAQATFEEAQAIGKRSILDSIDDAEGIFRNDRKSVIHALAEMRPDEQKRYREDASFRQQVDKALTGVLKGGPSLEAAHNMLEGIAAGEKSGIGIIERLALHALDFNTDEGQVIRDLEAAFRADPALRQRLIAPQSDAEKGASQRFFSVLKDALDDDEYQRYAKPLLESGSLALEVQNELDSRFLHHDKKAVLENLMSASDTERARLAAGDAEAARLADKVFEDFDSDFRKLALTTLSQGGMRPEDRVRSFVLGAGASQEEVLMMLNAFSPEQRRVLSAEYAGKYGSNFTVDLLDKVSKPDRDRAELLTKTAPFSTAETFNMALDRHSKSRSGLGSVLMDTMWDGTGMQADHAVNRFTAAMALGAIEGRPLAAALARQNALGVFDSLNIYKESKGKFAEMSANVGITAAAIGGAFFTGGASLSLLGKLAVGGAAGAAIKVGMKSSIMGSDYDWSASQVALDGGTGFIYGATAFAGPQALAKFIGVGEKATEVAAGNAIAQIAQGGGKRMIYEGAEEVVRDGIAKIVQTQLLHGSTRVPVDAVTSLANFVGYEGSKETVKLSIAVAISEALKQQGQLSAMAIEYGIPSLASGLAGGTAGTIRGISTWDSDRPFDENLVQVGEQAATSAAVGAASALVFKATTNAIGKGIEYLRPAPSVDPSKQVESFIDGNLEKVARFQTRPVQLKAVQTQQAVMVQTMEGPVQAHPGDWILTGVKGEQWPVPADVFARKYDAVAGLQDMFQKKVVQSFAIQTPDTMQIFKDGVPRFTGKPGDWIVIGADGSKYFVDNDVFLKTYQAVATPGADAALTAATTTASLLQPHQTFDYPSHTRELTGMGGEYEEGARKMVVAGVKWLAEHPNADPKFAGNPAVFGVISESNADARALVAVVDAAEPDASGAMYHLAILHILKVREVGWDEYIKLLNQPKR